MIICFDIETTGLNKDKDFIIQFSAIKFDEHYKIIETYNKYIQPVGNYTMSIGALAKHHILPEKLKNEPYFADIAQEILDLFKGCKILTYNGITFDLPFLREEFKRIGIDWDYSDYELYDAFMEETRRNGNSLGNTFKRYFNKTMEEANLDVHDALSDVKATIKIFNKQQKIQKYEPEDIVSSDRFIKKMEFIPGELSYCFTTGKYRGVSIDYAMKNDMNYINWIINESKFSDKTKNFVKNYVKSKLQ